MVPGGSVVFGGSGLKPTVVTLLSLERIYIPSVCACFICLSTSLQKPHLTHRKRDAFLYIVTVSGILHAETEILPMVFVFPTYDTTSRNGPSKNTRQVSKPNRHMNNRSCMI
jgi:hypothetical protein